MDARLAFFTLEDFAGTVLVTCETTVLRRAITYRRWRRGWNRTGGLRGQSSTLNAGIRLTMENNTHFYALGIRSRKWRAFPLLRLTLLDCSRFFSDRP